MLNLKSAPVRWVAQILVVALLSQSMPPTWAGKGDLGTLQSGRIKAQEQRQQSKNQAKHSDFLKKKQNPNSNKPTFTSQKLHYPEPDRSTYQVSGLNLRSPLAVALVGLLLASAFTLAGAQPIDGGAAVTTGGNTLSSAAPITPAAALAGVQHGGGDKPCLNEGNSFPNVAKSEQEMKEVVNAVAQADAKLNSDRNHVLTLINQDSPDANSVLNEFLEKHSPKEIVKAFPNSLLPQSLIAGVDIPSKEALRAYILAAEGINGNKENALNFFKGLLKKSGVTLDEKQTKELLSLLPSLKSMGILKKSGVNTHYKVSDNEGGNFFVKVFSLGDARNTNQEHPELASLHEAAASQLASKLTGGLVPEGRTVGGLVITYPLIEIDQDESQRVFPGSYPNIQHQDILPRLNEKQTHQLFVHMISDLLLGNDDAHPFQFKIDKNGNLVSFDKGNSDRDKVFNSHGISLLPLDFSTIDRQKSWVYGPFIDRLKKNPDLLKKIAKSDEVQKILGRAESLPDREILDTMTPLFRAVGESLGRHPSPDTRKAEIEASYLSRFRELRANLADHFKVDRMTFYPDPKTATDYHSETSGPLHVDLMKFQPDHPLRIVTNAFHGCLHVSDCVKEVHALGGVNGGFFASRDPSKASGVGWALSKALTKMGQPGKGYLYPVGIVMENKVLYQDSGKSLPTWGCTNDMSKCMVGYSRSNWKGRLKDETGKELALDLQRRTDLDPTSPDSYLYIPLDSGQYRRIKIVNERIASIETLNEAQLKDAVSNEKSKNSPANGFVLNEDDLTNIKALDRKLKVGMHLNIRHHFDSSTPGWEHMDNVGNGGTVLIQSGVALDDPDPTKNLNRLTMSGAYTFLCSLGNGVGYIGTGRGGTQKDLQSFLKEKGCVDAITLDCGGSPTHFLNYKDGVEVGAKIPVGDTLVIVHSPIKVDKDAALHSQIISLLERNQNNEFIQLLDKNVEILNFHDRLGRGVLHLAARYGDSNSIHEILNRVGKKALQQKDYFGDTPFDMLLERGLHYDYPNEIPAETLVSRATQLFLKGIADKKWDFLKEVLRRISELDASQLRNIEVLREPAIAKLYDEPHLQTERENFHKIYKKVYQGRIAKFLSSEQVVECLKIEDTPEAFVMRNWNTIPGIAEFVQGLPPEEIKARDFKGRNLLLNAAEVGPIEAFQTLYHYGSSFWGRLWKRLPYATDNSDPRLEERDSDNMNYLQLAARAGNKDVVHFLLDEISIDSFFEDTAFFFKKGTPLFFLAQGGHTESFTRVLDKFISHYNANFDRIKNYYSIYLDDPIEMAAKAGKTEIIRIAASKLPFFLGEKFYASQLLRSAIEGGHPETVRTLVEIMKSKGPIGKVWDLYAPEALQEAIKKGNAEIVQIFLDEMTVELIEKANTKYETMIQLAAQTGHAGILRSLLTKFRKACHDEILSSGKQTDDQIKELLFKKYLQPIWYNWNSPLRLSAQSGCWDCIEALLREAPNIDWEVQQAVEAMIRAGRIDEMSDLADHISDKRIVILEKMIMSHKDLGPALSRFMNKELGRLSQEDLVQLDPKGTLLGQALMPYSPPSPDIVFALIKKMTPDQIAASFRVEHGGFFWGVKERKEAPQILHAILEKLSPEHLEGEVRTATVHYAIDHKDISTLTLLIDRIGFASVAQEGLRYVKDHYSYHVFGLFLGALALIKLKDLWTDKDLRAFRNLLSEFKKFKGTRTDQMGLSEIKSQYSALRQKIPKLAGQLDIEIRNAGLAGDFGI